MKKIIHLSFLLFLLTACNVPASPAQSSAEANQVQATAAKPQAALAPETTALPAEINAPLVDAPSIVFIDMLDTINGWGITETQVVRTNDGGVTWYNVTPQGLTQAGYSLVVHFLDVSHAWVGVPDPNGAPNKGVLYRTSDGGVTWTSNSTPFGDGNMAFVDINNGWMMADFGAGVGSNAIYIFQTTDAGLTWNRTYTNNPDVEGSSDSLPLSGLKFNITPINMQTAWVNGVVYAPGSVYLFRTDDAGKTWVHVDLPLSAEGKVGDLSVDDVKFFSSTEGVLSLRIGADTMQTVFYTTSDSGNTWQLAPAKLPDSGGLSLISAQEMVFYNRDQFYVTKDAAQTWSIIPPDVVFGDDFVNMSFANSSIGWVIVHLASDHYSLYKTTDGGATWFPIIP